jgi:hypothetical protein
MFRRSTARLLGLTTAVLALAITAACSDTTSPIEPSFGDGTKLPKTSQVTLAYCPGTPYDSTTRTIGAGGGIITAGRGTFVIPAGAVAVPTTIRMVQPADSLASYRFYPEGLQFTKAQPALRIDIGKCNKGLRENPPQIVYIAETGQVLEVLPTTLVSKDLLQAMIFHFSRYAVAY